LTRNTTNGITELLNAYPFAADDEVLIAKHDYPYVKTLLDNLHNSGKVKVRVVEINIETETDEAIIEFYKEAISDNTRLLVLTHMTHRTGRILPIKEISSFVQSQGIEVMVDAAHSVGHFDFSIAEMNPDYLVSSLHKWLGAAHGNGLLYIANKHIEKLQPINSYYGTDESKISKFNQMGTLDFYTPLTIAPALDFHESIGLDKKYNRICELVKYADEQLQTIPGYSAKRVFKDANYGGMLTIRIGQNTNNAYSKTLFESYKIITKAVGLNKGSGLRISLNLHNSEADIDQFVKTLKQVI